MDPPFSINHRVSPPPPPHRGRDKIPGYLSGKEPLTFICTKYIQSTRHSVCLLSSELGLSTPSLASECAPPPDTKWGGGDIFLPAGEGLGESHFRRLEKRLCTLPILWLEGSMCAFQSTEVGWDCYCAIVTVASIDSPISVDNSPICGYTKT